MCPLANTKPSSFSTGSRLKLTKAGRKRDYCANSEHFYDSVYFAAAKALLLAEGKDNTTTILLIAVTGVTTKV